jgi:hypothetical protein
MRPLLVFKHSYRRNEHGWINRVEKRDRRRAHHVADIKIERWLERVNDRVKGYIERERMIECV